MLVIVFVVSLYRLNLLGCVTLASVFVAVNWLEGSYRSRLTLSVLNDTPHLTANLLVSVAVTACTLEASAPRDLTMLPWLVTIGLALVLAARSVTYTLVRLVRCTSLVGHPTLVVGSGRVATRLGVVLQERHEYGLELLGFVSGSRLPTPLPPAPVLGTYNELSDVIRRTGARVVLVAFTSQPATAMVDMLRSCDRTSCEIFCVPRLYELSHVAWDMDQVWDVPLLRLRRRAFRALGRTVKRAFDVAVAAWALVLLSPVMLACALAVVIDGGLPVLFRQERVGRDGRSFPLLKFRTLTPATGTEGGQLWNVHGDGRITRTCRFLRRSSLDELPQLFNVLAGHMSLVGPRPERPYFVTQFASAYNCYSARHRVQPGITGWAQIHGLRGDTSIEDRTRFDNHYIENWSLWNDIKILLRTVPNLARGSG